MTEMKINSINLCATWNYASKNPACVCSRPLHMPTANEVQKKLFREIMLLQENVVIHSIKNVLIIILKIIW